MSEREEIIAFLYPTLIQEGMVASGLHAPTFILKNIDFTKSYPFYISAGFIFNDDKKYATEVDVFCDDESVLKVGEDQESTMNVPVYDNPLPGQTALISSMFMKSVELKKPGIYTFVMKLFSYETDVTEKILVDIKSCSLVVAELRGEV